MTPVICVCIAESPETVVWVQKLSKLLSESESRIHVMWSPWTKVYVSCYVNMAVGMNSEDFDSNVKKQDCAKPPCPVVIPNWWKVCTEWYGSCQLSSLSSLNSYCSNDLQQARSVLTDSDRTNEGKTFLSLVKKLAPMPQQDMKQLWIGCLWQLYFWILCSLLGLSHSVIMKMSEKCYQHSKLKLIKNGCRHSLIDWTYFLHEFVVIPLAHLPE